MTINQNNHCKELADMLGVEIGERFNVLDDEDRIYDLSPYCIDAEDGILDTYDEPAVEPVYKSLIDGSWSVQKLPANNTAVDVYFYVDAEGHIKAKVDENSAFDLAMYNMGNYFRNENYALVNVKEMIQANQKLKEEKGIAIHG